jgi:hypothetical protein
MYSVGTFERNNLATAWKTGWSKRVVYVRNRVGQECVHVYGRAYAHYYAIRMYNTTVNCRFYYTVTKRTIIIKSHSASIRKCVREIYINCLTRINLPRSSRVHVIIIIILHRAHNVAYAYRVFHEYMNIGYYTGKHAHIFVGRSAYNLLIITHFSIVFFLYCVAAELGDFDPRRHTPGYVSEFRFVSNQNAELETRIGEIHKELT